MLISFVILRAIEPQSEQGYSLAEGWYLHLLFLKMCPHVINNTSNQDLHRIEIFSTQMKPIVELSLNQKMRM